MVLRVGVRSYFGSEYIELDGERKVYSVNVYPLYTLGKAQGNISLIFDIPEKQRQLEQMAQMNQLKDQLFTIVSHNIRSPLALQFQLVELLEADRQSFAAFISYMNNISDLLLMN